MIKLLAIVTLFLAQSLAKDSVVSHFNDYLEYNSPEKLYLHIDRNLFVPGETLFFNGYLVNSSQNSQMPQSNFMYVELLAKDSIVSRVMIKRSGDSFPGHLSIPQDISPGNYIVRGYTNWMKNMPPEFMFYSKIQITSNKQAQKNKQQTDSTIIHFYPESGRYLVDELSVLAFKTNRNGLSGVLYNTKGEFITSIKTEHDGMGAFQFIPEPATGYFIKTDKNEIFQLPEPEISGGVIHLTNSLNKINITASVTAVECRDSIFIIMYNNSYLYGIHQLKSNSNGLYKKQLALSKEQLPYGINHIALVTGAGNLLAERLFFIYREAAKVNIDFQLDKNYYHSREKANAIIKLTDNNGKPVRGQFSVSVLDGNFTQHTQKESIESYMLLSSEITGKINNPTFYFNNRIPMNYRNRYLDLLMMVQGWRYYDTEAILRGAVHYKEKKEYVQSLRGSVKKLSDKKAAESSLVAISHDSQYIAEIDEWGNFNIEGVDFNNDTEFILNVTGKNGSRMYKEIECWENPPAPLFNYDSLYASSANWGNQIIGEDDSVAVTLAPIINSAPDTDYAMTDTLKEIVVRTKAYYRPKFNPSPYGQAFDKSQIKERIDLEKYDFRPLTDYLLETYPSFVRGDNDRILSTRSGSIKQSAISGSQSVSTKSGKSEVILYIDGIKQESTSELKAYSVRDVETLVVLRGNDGALYHSTWGVVLLTLRRGGESYKENFPVVSTYKPLGWQMPVQFEAPVYDGKPGKNTAPDYRTTIFWQPYTQTDETGTASISFYTSDSKNPCLLRIEGISQSGEYISGQVEIQVQ